MPRPRKATIFTPTLFRHTRNPQRVEYKGTKPFHMPDGNTLAQGDQISRRQYENLRYTAGGWLSKSEYERAIHGNIRTVSGKKASHETTAFRFWAQEYADEIDAPTRKVMGPDSDFSKAFARALRDNFQDKSPDGSFATLLELMGFRSASDTWNVGDTP